MVRGADTLGRVATPTAPAADELKGRVKSFWEATPCGSSYASAPEGTREYFEEVERARYELEPFLPRFADFDGARGKRLLEIGVGLGTDFVNFVRAGAEATGVDLTERGVELVRRRLELEGLSANVVVADAERLPFPDRSFDRVYSWGVLHHTPDTPRAVREALRVLAPGGEFCIMLYARVSWVALGFWLRYGLLVGRPWRSFADVIAVTESDGTKAYTEAEVRQMFAGADELRIDRVITPYDRRYVGRLADRVPQLGWFLVVRGRARAA